MAVSHMSFCNLASPPIKRQRLCSPQLNLGRTGTALPAECTGGDAGRLSHKDRSSALFTDALQRQVGILTTSRPPCWKGQLEVRWQTVLANHSPFPHTYLPAISTELPDRGVKNRLGSGPSSPSYSGHLQLSES